ncbi:MAG: hypothetical protein JWO08_3102 [Verrucomicrobiaceae bacterium]|nr:hypothetical protein [Verrucomicrobiaceae bacterium]
MSAGAGIQLWRWAITGAFCLLSQVMAAEAPPPPGLPGLTDGEQVQNAISIKLSEATYKQREKQKPKLKDMVDDIHRTVHLSEDRLALLNIAVEGVLLRLEDDRARNVVAEAEKRIKGVQPKQVDKVLAAIGSFSSSGMRLTESTLWRDTLRQLLKPEELQKWTAVEDSRAAYRSKSIAEFILLKVRPMLALTEEQAGKMLPLITQSVKDYLPDASSSFSSDGEERGLYSGYAQMLILGVPEDKAHSVLTEDQWSKWRAAAGEYAGNWDWIKTIHDRRMKGQSTE